MEASFTASGLLCCAATSLASLESLASLAGLASLAVLASLGGLASLASLASLAGLAGLASLASLASLAGLAGLASLASLASLAVLAVLAGLASLAVLASLNLCISCCQMHLTCSCIDFRLGHRLFARWTWAFLDRDFIKTISELWLTLPPLCFPKVMVLSRRGVESHSQSTCLLLDTTPSQSVQSVSSLKPHFHISKQALPARRR